MPLKFITLKSLILLSCVNLKKMCPNAFKGSLALWMFKTHSRHVKTHAPSGGPRIILIPALPVRQYVLTLVFILLEDRISHLQTSWKFLQHRWPQSDLIYKHNPRFHLDIAPMAAVPHLQAHLPFDMGLTCSHIWWWQLLTGGLSITSATQMVELSSMKNVCLFPSWSHWG